MKPDRTHEVSTVDVLQQLDGSARFGLPLAVAVVGSAIAHAILDLAQATREANVR